MQDHNRNGFHALPHRSELDELKTLVWDLRGDIGMVNGRVDTLRQTTTDALEAAFGKIDTCLARVTQADGRQRWMQGRLRTLEEQVTRAIIEMRQRPTVEAPPPPPAPTFLGSLNDLAKACASLLPEFRETVAALAMLLGAIAALGLVPEPPKQSASMPTSIGQPSAP